MNRRDFLVRAGAVCAGAVGASEVLRRVTAKGAPITGTSIAPDSVFAGSASDCPMDTVVIVMMENRSFDHYLGWLGEDEAYLDAGRRRYGSSFFVDGSCTSRSRTRRATRATRPAESFDPEKVETRGCSFQDPGHTWDAARVQRDSGFLAPGSGNDEFALTYYSAKDLPLYAALGTSFHRVRPLARVAARPHVPEPPVLPVRAVRGPTRPTTSIGSGRQVPR